MNCIVCHRRLNKSASPSIVIGPVCLSKAMPRPKRGAKGAEHAVPVLPGQMRLPLVDGAQQILQINGYTHISEIAGKLCGLVTLMFTTGLVVGLDEIGYECRYCFESEQDAKAALEAWNGHGHPSGPWIKCKGRGIDLLNPEFGVQS